MFEIMRSMCCWPESKWRLHIQAPLSSLPSASQLRDDAVKKANARACGANTQAASLLLLGDNTIGEGKLLDAFKLWSQLDPTEMEKVMELLTWSLMAKL